MNATDAVRVTYKGTTDIYRCNISLLAHDSTSRDWSCVEKI